MTGLIYTIPFLLLAIVATAILASNFAKTHALLPGGTGSSDRALVRWLALSLIGTALVGLITILLYYYATMRFAADFSSPLLLLALLGFWQGYELLLGRRFLRYTYALIAILLAGATIGISTLLAISSYKYRFVDLNPALMKKMVEFFAR